MIMETVILTSETQRLMPFHPDFFPFFKPSQFTSGLDEELHLHLFKLSHPENELPGNNLIAECLSNLSNSKWDLHPACLLDIEKIHKYPLGGFGTKIDFVGTFCR